MGMLSRVVAVLGLLLAGTVVVVATGTPAGAAVVPCTQTFTQGVHREVFGQDAITLNTYGPFLGGARIADVDVRVRFRARGGSNVQMGINNLTTPTRRLFQGYPAGGEPMDLTFDDEAGGSWSPSMTSGSVRPDAWLGDFDGGSLDTEWRLTVSSFSGGLPLYIEEVAVVLTATECDSDGDNVPERFDNCPFVVNPDQRDWDGDGTGNACDSTPGTDPNAPLPPTTPTTPTVPTVPSVPTTTSVPGCSASCVYERTVELRHQAKKRRLVGAVVSVASGCQSGVPVTIWRQRSGADRQLVVLTSRYSGSFRTKAPRQPGRYYATVGSAGEPLCGAGQSPTVRVRRR